VTVNAKIMERAKLRSL